MDFIDIGLSFLIGNKNINAINEIDFGSEFSRSEIKDLSKEYIIPNQKNLKEIMDNCTVNTFGDTYILYGPNGKGVYFPKKKGERTIIASITPNIQNRGKTYFGIEIKSDSLEIINIPSSDKSAYRPIDFDISKLTF